VSLADLWEALRQCFPTVDVEQGLFVGEDHERVAATLNGNTEELNSG